MDARSVKVLYARYEWIATKLEREAYQKQITGKNKLRQFIPCDKALVFTKAMGDSGGVPSSVVIADAALTICPCHRGVGAKELWALLDQATKEIPNYY